jgi:putative ABC transport system permease protein
MIRDFKISFRHLWKNRLYTTINILGLSLALTCCSIIILHIRFELSYDRLHANGDRIARVLANSHPFTPYQMATALRDYFPEIEKITKTTKFNEGDFYVKTGERLIPERDLVYADSSFFKVFSFPLESGNADLVLQSPDRIMISSAFARKYFNGKNPSGQSVSLRVDDKVSDFTIEGVFNDFPENSHLHANILLPMEFLAQRRNPSSLTNWGNSFVVTYVLTGQPGMMDEINNRMPGLISRYIPSEIAEGLKFRLQPLRKIHLYSKDLDMDTETRGSISRVIIFASVAILVLVIAIVNFIVLSMALSFERISEFGIRKVIGAQRKELISLVTAEFAIIFILSFQISLMMVELFTPFVERNMNLKVSQSFLPNFITLALFLLVVILLGYLSSVIIANRVSRFRPIDAIKNTVQVNRMKVPSRGALVIFQFTVMIGLLSCLIGMQKQLRLLQRKELGFRPERLVAVNIPRNEINGYNRLKEEIAKFHFVSNISGAAYVPPNNEFWLFDVSNPINGEVFQFEEINSDYDFVETMGIELIQGRSFSKDHATDSMAILINETALRKLGLTDVTDAWLKGPEYYPSRSRMNIIGVFRDYHAHSLYDNIYPMAIILSPSMAFQMVIRLTGEAPDDGMELIRERWATLFPDDPMQFTFIDEGLRLKYNQEHRLFATIGLFTLLSVVISLLGLFGLSVFIIRRRTLEIGLRKVYGSTNSAIIYLLSRQFTAWVTVAMIIAFPLAWYIMNKWLQHFAYKTSLSWWIFVLSAIISLIIALLTISRQILAATSKNPVESLHYE